MDYAAVDYAVVSVTAATFVALMALSSLVVSQKAEKLEVATSREVDEVVDAAVSGGPIDTTTNEDIAATDDQPEAVSTDSEPVETNETPEEPALADESHEVTKPMAMKKSGRGWGMSWRSKKVVMVDEMGQELAEQKPCVDVVVATPKKSFRWTRASKNKAA